MAALDQRRQRLAQGRAGDPQLLGQLALGRKLAARREQADRIAVPSRSTVSSKVVGGRTGLNTASSATSLFIDQP